MNKEIIQKIINMAKKQPKMLFKVGYFINLSAKLGITTDIKENQIKFKYNEKEDEAVIITSKNCADYKCIVREGTGSVRLWEYIKVLVHLLTDKEIPPSPSEKAGQTAVHYAKEGSKILEELIVSSS